MDPITQGALGAACAQFAIGEHKDKPRTWLYGALGGMAADLDVLIRSSTDPLVAIDYHRHFTHSLAFVPVGGVLVALPFCFERHEGMFKLRPAARLIVLASVIGYATHGLLDAFTSYGTMLMWPFSNARVAWDSISIIDPVFTVPLLVGVALTRRRAGRGTGAVFGPARIALAFCALYMALGVWQHRRAMDAQAALLVQRGQQVVVEDGEEKRRCMPSLATMSRWRSVYIAARRGEAPRVFADRFDVPFFGPIAHTAGQSLPRYVHDGTNAQAFARWAHFTDGYMAVHNDEDGLPFIGDERYAVEVNSLKPMWGMRIIDEQTVERVTIRPSFGKTWEAMTGGTSAVESRAPPLPTGSDAGVAQ